jgi:hypothetical protein
MTAILPARPSPRTGQAPGNGHGDQRDLKAELRARISALDTQARDAAAAGAVEQSAKAILAALDCERRLAATGPQVLQVIKPRS